MTSEALRANRPQNLDCIEVAAESGVVPLSGLPCEVSGGFGALGTERVLLRLATTCDPAGARLPLRFLSGCGLHGFGDDGSLLALDHRCCRACPRPSGSVRHAQKEAAW